MQPIDLNEHARLAYEHELPPRVVPPAAQVIGWVWILIGASQIVGNLLSVVGALRIGSQLRALGADEAQVNQLMSDSRFATLSIAFFVGVTLILAVSVLGFIGGIGLLRLTDWGRRCTECACWGEALFVVALAAGFFSSVSGAPTPAPFLFGMFLFAVLFVPLVLMLRSLRSRAMWEAIWSENRRLRR